MQHDPPPPPAIVLAEGPTLDRGVLKVLVTFDQPMMEEAIDPADWVLTIVGGDSFNGVGFEWIAATQLEVSFPESFEIAFLYVLSYTAAHEDVKSALGVPLPATTNFPVS